MNLYDQLSQSLPVPNDTWTKNDILLYKLILTVASSVTDLNKEATQLLVKTAVDGVTAKLIAAPSTEAKQDALKTAIDLITAKLIVAPSTEAKQDTLKTAIDLITAKLIAAPATEAKQDTGNTSLASILAKIIAAPATEAKQDTQIGLVYARKGFESYGVTGIITTTAITLLLPIPGAGLYNYITTLLVTNSHATIGTEVQILDGDTDSLIFSGYAAPLGGGYSLSFPTPLKALTANKQIRVKCVTTGASVIVSTVGFRAV